MRLSKQRHAIPTWGLENLRFAVIGLPTVKPISPEIEPETMNLPKEWIGSLVCGRLRKSGRHQGWECRWNAGRGTREQRTFRWKQMRSGRLLFFMWGFKESDAGEIENMPSYYFKEKGNLKKYILSYKRTIKTEIMMNSASLVLGWTCRRNVKSIFFSLETLRET